VTALIFTGVVVALIGAAVMVASLIPEDAMVALPLPSGKFRYALMPVGVVILMVGVVIPAVGVTTLPPTPTPTLQDTPTPTDTPTRTPAPTIAIVQTSTPRPPTLTASPTLVGTLAPQQSLRDDAPPDDM